MEKKALVSAVMLFVFFTIGCAQVQVKAPKEPIKVDITMRLDVYQHVIKDIDNIESVVSGKTEQKPQDGMKLNFLVANAYAQDESSSDMEQAIMRRKDGHPWLVLCKSRGEVGDNNLGLVKTQGASAPMEQAIMRRKDRHSQLVSWESRGEVGENREGLVEAKGANAPPDLVDSENADRAIIYNALAEKNGVPLEDVQKIYATRLQEGAPAGTPIEVMDVSGSYEWKIK